MQDPLLLSLVVSLSLAAYEVAPVVAAHDRVTLLPSVLQVDDNPLGGGGTGVPERARTIRVAVAVRPPLPITIYLKVYVWPALHGPGVKGVEPERPVGSGQLNGPLVVAPQAGVSVVNEALDETPLVEPHAYVTRSPGLMVMSVSGLPLPTFAVRVAVGGSVQVKSVPPAGALQPPGPIEWTHHE